MEKLYKQLEGLVTKWKQPFSPDEFFIARFKLIVFYSLTTIVILGATSWALYRSILGNFAESIVETVPDPRVAHIIFDRTEDILKDRFITIDSLIIIIVVIISFFLTRETLKPIKENMEKQKRFIADASHDLRTPVAVVISGLEVALRNKHLNLDSARTSLQDTLLEMKDFSKLTNYLLDISKYDVKSKDFFEILVLKDLLTKVAKKIEPLVLKNDVKLNVHINTTVSIFGNSIELERVFFNILSNAIFHTPQGGEISIRDMEERKTCAVTIEDTGEGISKANINKVFDPFFRGDPSRNVEGAGLGLTLAKKIIENHKGNIKIKSELGKGTIVIVTLPVSS